MRTNEFFREIISKIYKLCILFRGLLFCCLTTCSLLCRAALLLLFCPDADPSVFMSSYDLIAGSVINKPSNSQFNFLFPSFYLTSVLLFIADVIYKNFVRKLQSIIKSAFLFLLMEYKTHLNGSFS